MVDPNPNPEANQLPEAASLPDGFVESSSAEAVVDYKEEILLEPGSRPEVVIEDGGGSSLGKLVEHVVDHSESTAAADAGPAHGEGNAKGQSVEGAQTHAITSEEIAVAGSAENKKKETTEVKRKSVKRAFKSEKEFLEFTLKYQQVLTERDSAIAVRDKLESLCRELQRQNKLLMDECKRVSTEGQHLRLDLSNKFQDAIKEVSNKLEEQKDECISQLKENEIDSDDDELMQLLMDDTDELMMLDILKEEHMLLELAQRPHSRRYVHWDREGAHTRLMKDYFDENPTWGPDVFRRRFRMRKELFTRIVNALGSHDEYFQWRVDAAGRKGLSPLQKCTVAIRQLAFGGPTDHYDEYLRVAKQQQLKIKLKQLIDQYSLSEQQHATQLKQKSLELQLSDLKLQQHEEKLKQEQGQMKLYAEQVAELLATEKNLRLQLNADGEKFQQFQEALLKSNEVFETFKQEIEKMTKSIKDLNQENTFLKSKSEKSDITLIELANEREFLKKQLERTRNQKDRLESLCRSLQAERKTTSVAGNSSDSIPV